MRSARSSETGKGNPGRVLIGCDIRRFWAVPALLMLSLLAVCPVACLLIGGNRKTRQDFVLSMGENTYMVCTVLFFAFAIAAAVAVFGYLQRQSEANLIHALPVSRKRLFAVHYGTGLLMLLIPVLIAGLSMMAFGELPLMLIRWIGLSWLACWAFFSIAVFAGTVSGNLFMHIFNYLFFMFLPAMLLALLSWFAEMLLYGYSTPDVVNRILSAVTPAAALVGLPSAGRVIGYVLCSALLTVLSLAIYRRRAVENTGDSLIFSWTRLALVGLVTFLGSLMMGGLFWTVSDAAVTPRSQTALLVGMAFGFAATFLVISLIVYRGKDIFRKKNLIAGAAALLAAALFVGGLAADLPGYEKVRFDPEMMSRVSVTSADSDSFLSTSRFDASCFVRENGEDEAAGAPLWLEERTNIEAVCRMQNVLAEEGEEAAKAAAGRETDVDEEPGNHYYGSVSLEGKTKEGKLIRREYGNVSREIGTKIRPEFETIYESAEFKDMFRLSNLRYAVDQMTVNGYAKGTGNDLGAMTLSEKDRAELIAALDRDFAEQTYARYEEMEEITAEERPGETYYVIDIEMADSLDGCIGINVTSESPAAYAWLKKHFRPAP